MKYGYATTAALALLLGTMPSAHAKKAPLEVKSGTIVYVQMIDPHIEEVLLYLNDVENTVAILVPKERTPDDVFSPCLTDPNCMEMTYRIHDLEMKCQPGGRGLLTLLGVCASSNNMKYVLGTHKGQQEIGLFVGNSSDEQLLLVPGFKSAQDIVSGDPAIALFRRYDPAWSPVTGHAWPDETIKLSQQLVIPKVQSSDHEYACLTNLKAGQPSEIVNQCGVPNHSNSDMNQDQLVFEVPLWSSAGLEGTREVLVYVDKRNNTVENVQWSSRIDR